MRSPSIRIASRSRPLYELLGATSNTPSRQAATVEAKSIMQRAIEQLPRIIKSRADVRSGTMPH